MQLKSEQRRLYELLPPDARCFVRVCDDDGALWVSDLPRKYENHPSLIPGLADEGFSVRLDEKSRLWYVDWTQERWLKTLETLPLEMPLFPQKSELHEIYALCRLLLAHPAPLDDTQLPMLRRTAKWTVQQPGALSGSVQAAYEEAALRLREGKPVAHAAGRILAGWLYEQGKHGKENNP